MQLTSSYRNRKCPVCSRCSSQASGYTTQQQLVEVSFNLYVPVQVLLQREVKGICGERMGAKGITRPSADPMFVRW